MPTHKRHPLYIGATASTPIAAVLILKGLRPGAALVFLLTGPATNMATLTVLVNVLGKRATAIYLAAIAVFAVLSGLAVDQVYALLGISAKAAAGQAAEILPDALRWGSAALVLLISIKPVTAGIRGWFSRSAGVQS